MGTCKDRSVAGWRYSVNPVPDCLPIDNVALDPFDIYPAQSEHIDGAEDKVSPGYPSDAPDFTLGDAVAEHFADPLPRCMHPVLQYEVSEPRQHPADG